jgi:hypothetical protein
MKSGIIYKGPSRIDGAPIVVLATYSNRNTKTGAVVQTYILREDINPLEASARRAQTLAFAAHVPLRGTPTTDPTRKHRAGPPLLCQFRAGRPDRLARLSQGRLSRCAGSSVARIARPRSRRALWHLRGSGGRARPRVDRAASRGGHVDSLHTPKALAPRYRNAIRGQSRRGARPLGRRAAHFPRDHGAG